MRKWLLTALLVAVMAMAVPAYAQIVNTATGLSATIKDNNQNQNTNLNTDVNTNVNTNVFTPINANSNIQGQQQGQLQGQQQGQLQGQLQGQNNDQNIKQNVSFKSPTPLLPSPFHAVPELNFGAGKMIDVTRSLPNFSMYGIKPLGAEPIREVIDVTANVKFKKLYKKVLATAKDIVDDGNNTKEVRYQIIRAEAQKSWTTGGNLGGGSSILSTTGLAGTAGSAGMVPQWGGTKADDLFTIIFVKVSM